MRYIQGIRIKNYRVLKDIALGSISSPMRSLDAAESESRPFKANEPLTPITAVIGRNGYGKSTLCDALGFLVDCLKSDAEQACNLRGGFDKIASEGSNRVVEFEIQYGTLIYSLCIAADQYNVPYIFSETLSHIAQDFETADSMNFFVRNGVGKVIRPGLNATDIRLADARRSVLATFGNLTDYGDIVAFREFLDSWYLCFFSPDSARISPLAGSQKHLSKHGGNLANVIRYWEREHPERLKDLIDRVFNKILGVHKIETQPTEDGRLLIRFFERTLTKPFYASQMSDGTLKLIAYLLLLGDPNPPPLICFEEPENGLYHRLLGAFVDEIRARTPPANSPQQQTAQFFITTHQPYLVDALQPKEVWILDKGDDAFARIGRASDNAIVQSMVQEGMPLGALWFSEYFDE